MRNLELQSKRWNVPIPIDLYQNDELEQVLQGGRSTEMFGNKDDQVALEWTNMPSFQHYPKSKYQPNVTDLY